MKKKVIIIGAGFSGLSAAAFMARDGWDVDVIDQHETAGGRARQLREEGFTFDMGPSWYWMPDIFEHFFEQFGKKPSDYYKLTRLDPSYRIYWDNGHTDLPAGFEQLKEVFEQMEKGSAGKLEQYLAQAKTKYDIGMKSLVYKPGQSIREFLDLDVLKNVLRLDVFTSIKSHISRYFKNERLRQIVAFPVLFLGALPQDTPALYSLMNYADMKGGTWYPEGGMYSIVRAMQEVASSLGARFHFNTKAEQIIIERGSVQRVRTNNGIFEADAVISSADYHFTETSLLSEEYRTYSNTYWNSRIMAPSCLLYYIGLNKKLKNVQHHSLFFDVPFDQHAKEIYQSPAWPSEPLCYMNVTTCTDASMAPEGCENLFLLIPVAANLPGDTEDIRKKYLDKIIGRIEKHTGQSIRDAIIYQRSFSVSDFKREYNSFKGNAYGLANVLKQTALLKPGCRSKKVKNLFYAGQLTVPGPGVPPSLISGEVVSHEVNKFFNRKKSL